MPPLTALRFITRSTGEGFPLVLLHGGGSTIGTTFGRILPQLAVFPGGHGDYMGELNTLRPGSLPEGGLARRLRAGRGFQANNVLFAEEQPCLPYRHPGPRAQAF